MMERGGRVETEREEGERDYILLENCTTAHPMLAIPPRNRKPELHHLLPSLDKMHIYYNDRLHNYITCPLLNTSINMMVSPPDQIVTN